MDDILAPIAKRWPAGRYGAKGDAGVTLGFRPVSSLWQIAGWADFDKKASTVLAAQGLSNGGNFRFCERADDVSAWRIAPDKILIEGCQNLSKYMTPDLVTLDLSHARAVVNVEGHQARTLLSNLIAIDVSEPAFGPGEFIQTGIHHISVLMHCTGSDKFDVFIPSTWAESVFEWLFENALAHGILIIQARTSA